jgi:hypothetical protein
MGSQTVTIRRADGTEIVVDAEDAFITAGLTAADYYLLEVENQALRDWVAALESEVPDGAAAVTEKIIQSVVMSWAMQQKHHALVLPNSNTFFQWEADLITVTRAGLTHEFEIKLNPADYRRDAAKEYKHWTLRKQDGFGPGYFWYVTYCFDIDPPEHAGWLKAQYSDGEWAVFVRKDAPRLGGRKITDRQIGDIARMLSWRIANYARRHYVEGGGVSRAENNTTYQKLRFELEQANRALNCYRDRGDIRTWDKLVAEKNAAYAERNRLVVALSKVYPSHLCRHESGEWEDDWRNIVCVHLPTGQATWHIHDSEIDLFEHLPWGKNHWDGHTVEEKYARLKALDTQTSLSARHKMESE